MRKGVFGRPIAAIDVEHLPADTGPIDFVRLCGALIGRALADRVGSFTLPEISERINVPDGGVDAEYTTPEALSVPETGGLIGPGKTVFQFKYRDTSATNRSTIVQRLAQKLRLEFPRVAPKCDRYVLLTNVHLSGAQVRRLRDSLMDSYPAFGSNPVLWGAADIALALNQVPHLRHLFFSEGGLCTLDFAEEELKAAYSKIGWPPFINRDHELAVVDTFVKDATSRFLKIIGPKYVGKTRLVIEAMKRSKVPVVWAAAPEYATLEVFRELDSSDIESIFVVDRCDKTSIQDIDERAEARQRLKTIAISVGPELPEGPETMGGLVVRHFGYEDALKLIESIIPRMPFLQQSWLQDATGGIPGLILHVAALLKEAQISPHTSADEVHRRLGALLERQYLFQLSSSARRALEILSLLPVIGIQGSVGKEMEEVCRALDLSPEVLESELPSLKNSGLVRQRGRFIEVVPPRLAEHLASYVLNRPDKLLAALKLALALEPGAFLRFLERFRNLPNDEVKAAISRLFLHDGWFPDLDSLIKNAKGFELLAPAAPIPALRCLESILMPLSEEELKIRVVGDARRSLVWVLEDLALRSATFEGAAKLLLVLAGAENETFGINTRGVFTSLFHWQHPEVPASLASRLHVLREGAKSASPTQRKIIATACGEAFKNVIIMHHHAKGSAIPERPYRPETWEEVRRYATDIFALLNTLSNDQDAEVREAAIKESLDSFRNFVNISLTSEGFHALGKNAFEALEEIGGTAHSARLRSKVVSELELALLDLTEGETAKASPAAKEAIEQVKNLLEKLTGTGFRDRLWRWVGPRSWGLDARLDDNAETLTFANIQAVASELLRKPELFEQHVDWLTDEEAEHRARLFQMLGEGDKGGALFKILLSRFVQPFGPQAFSAYFQGWYKSDPDGAERTLDDLLESHPDLAAGILGATCSIPASSKTIDRLLRLIAKGSMRRSALAGQIAFSLWWDQLSPDSVEKLIKALDDRTSEVRSSLLFPLLIRVARGAEITLSLRSLAWDFLDSTFPVDNNIRRHDWDGLAARLGSQEPARLGSQEPDRLVDIVERVVKESLAERDRRFNLDHELPRVWRTLEERNRIGLLRMLLRFAMNPEPPYWIDWMVSRLIDPSRDREALLQFANENGIEGARVVALNLDAAKLGFWELARDLIVGWGEDDQIKGTLASRLFSGGWWGSAVPMIRTRIEGAKKLLADSDPKVAHWAQEAISDLEDWRQRELREDQEEWIWDYRIRRSELEGMLQQQDSPERLWAISRLLKDAPPKRVLELLTLEEIMDALPKIRDLDERTRRTWEGYARFWSQPH
jgi:hypothetical protein